MSKKLLLYLFLSLISQYSYGQASAEELAKAQDELAKIQVIFSEEHIEYAKAAIDLAVLYYQDEFAEDEGYELAYRALTIARKEGGIEGPLYKEFLSRIPNAHVLWVDANVDIDAVKASGDLNSILYAEKLIKLSKACIPYLMEQQEVYEYALKAYQILAQLPLETTQPVYDYANQILPQEILEILKQEMRLDRARENKDSIELADALVAYSALIITYQGSDLMYRSLDSCYRAIKVAFQIYEKKLGKEHPKYQKAYSTFTKGMQELYPIEKDILGRIKNHETANDSFITDFRQYLKVITSSRFVTYEPKDAFLWVLDDLEKYHGGVNSRYYIIVNAIADAWDLDEDEQKLFIQKNITAQALAAFGVSEEYITELIKEIGLSEYKEEMKDVIQRYQYAFKVLDSIEFERPFDINQEESLLQKHIKDVIQPYRFFLINKHNLILKKELYGGSSDEYLSSAFQTAWEFIKLGDLVDYGDAILLKELKQLKDNNIYLAEKWLDSILLYDISYASTLRPILPRIFPIVNLKRLIKAPLEKVEKKGYELLDILDFQLVAYSDLQELLIEGYFFNKKNPEYAKKALSLYKELLLKHENNGGKSDRYEYLLKTIVKNILIYDPWAEEQSMLFFEELIRVTKEYKSINSYYPASAKDYADWHYKNERIVSAESYYKLFVKLYKKNKSVEYIEASYNLARIYRKTGRPNKAFALYSETLVLSRATSQYIYSIKCLDDLGLIAHEKGDSEHAIKQFKEALNTLKSAEDNSLSKDRYNNFEMALLYVKIKRHIARVHLDDGNIMTAEKHYNIIKKFERDKNTPVSLSKDISLQYDLASLAEIKGDSLKATRYYQAAIRQIKDKDELAKANIAFANFYQQQEKDSMAAIYLKDALDIDLTRIQDNYNNLAEKERLLFLSPISERLNTFFNFALPKQDSSLTLAAFNAHLTVKGLALETSTNLQSICNETENTVLRNKCTAMQELRETLAKSTSLPLEEQEKISTQIVDLEKDIGIFSRELRNHFGKNNKKLDFYQLKEILKAVETEDSTALAIDFLIVDQVDEGGYKSSVYYAVVIGSDFKSPIFIRLTTEEDLQDVLAPDIAPNTMNYITDEFESRYLYELVWEPLLPYISDAKRLHICPSGILSKIAFGTLRTGDYDQRRIMDDWSIHYYSSLRDLLNPQVGTLNDGPVSVGLVGGVKFTFSEKEIQHLAQQYNIPNLDLEEAFKEQASENGNLAYSRGARGEDFSYLPGTLEEVNAISDVFPNHWVVNLLSGTLATEENLEVMTDNSPTILHIATHGYFFPTPVRDNEEDGWLNAKASASLEDKIASSPNPLLRSGLALAGINRVWKGGPEIKGLDDGILTALEVANMDLFNTDLVVLSACETGRGDIDNNEGIMGLRRAFKTAGAKQLLISLWKVPDEQTSELMQLFYKEYISGKSAHHAFEKAQYIMRRRYKNPYYWAAFLLIE
jgi:tetratricopeptide (TPR) repeat protein